MSELNLHVEQTAESEDADLIHMEELNSHVEQETEIEAVDLIHMEELNSHVEQAAESVDLIHMEPFRPKIWVRKLFDDGTELSPIICPRDVSDSEIARQAEVHLRQLPGINLNVFHQLKLLKELGKIWSHEEQCLSWPDEKSDSCKYHYQNGSYSYFDAMSLAALLKKLQPKKILAFVDELQYACFMDIIELLHLDQTVCTFIEPDPNRLEGYAPLPADSRHTIVCSTLKILDADYFAQLEAGDVLFVDTTHVAKAGSDVCRLFNRILPSLAPLVWIHIHDVFWPFEYPNGWLVEGRSWNELYILRAFLQFNNAFDIKFFLNYLWHFYETECVQSFPDSAQNPGGALWLQRK